MVLTANTTHVLIVVNNIMRPFNYNKSKFSMQCFKKII